MSGKRGYCRRFNKLPKDFHRDPFIFMFKPNTISTSTSTSCTVDAGVLITTVRVQTVLDLVPRLLGPRETWVPWMRENLASELVKHTINVNP